MRLAVLICVFGTLAAAQTDLPREVLALSRIKQKMRDNLSKLPDYTCIETIARMRKVNPAAMLRPVDSLRLEVLHAGDRELYALPGTKKFDDNVGHLTGGGASSSGEFALHARTIFLGDGQSKFVGEVKLRGHPALKYDYVLPLLSSGMTLSYDGKSGHVSMNGSFWADATTLDLMRLDVHAGDIPSYLPFQSAVSAVDYARVRIGATTTLLPQSAQVEMHMTTGVSDLNQIQFSQCRSFLTESAIRFDSSSEAQLKDVDLPAGIVLKLQLTRPIYSKTAVEGDPIEAHLVEAVKRKNEPPIPAGSLARGRIRSLEIDDSAHLVVALEFTDIEFDGNRAAFTGTLDHVDPLPEITWNFASSKTRRDTPDLPGVATFSVGDSHFELPTGFKMIWRIVALNKH